jgi:hypothetical protein
MGQMDRVEVPRGAYRRHHSCGPFAGGPSKGGPLMSPLADG